MSKNKQSVPTLIKRGGLICFMLFLIYSLSKNIFDYQKKMRFYEDYTMNLQKEKDVNKKLKSDIVKTSDYYSAEKKIRQRLNLLKPDEIALILPHSTPSPTPPTLLNQPIFQRWWELFFGPEM